MSIKAERKRLRKMFAVGQRITWGSGAVSHSIVEVRDDGLLVDVSDEPNTQDVRGVTQSADGRLLQLVTWDSYDRGNGPPRYADGTEPRKGR